MRICIDLTALNDNLSGIERYATQISLKMIETHPEDEYVLVFKEKCPVFFSELVTGTKNLIVVLPKANKLYFNQILLPAALNKIKADWYLFLAFPAPLLFHKRRMAVAIHDVTAWDFPETMKTLSRIYFKVSYLSCVRKSSAIITVSEFSKKRIHECLKASYEKIWLVYNGVDSKHFTVNPNKFDEVRKRYCLPEKYILSLSTLEPRKNLRLLVNAYDSLVCEGKTSTPLVLAGRKGWKMDNLLSEVSEKTREKIIITGFIEDSDLPELYSMALFFVFPSLYEGFGIPPLEAMMCKTPVLSSFSSSMPEILGKAAVFFENNNLEDLKKKIIYMEDLSEEEREKLITLGCKQAKLYSWEKESGKLHERMTGFTV